MVKNLPQWRCHKVVGAFKIAEILAGADADSVLVPVQDMAWPIPRVTVPPEFFRARSSDNSRKLRYEEYIGGYLVQYEDGYLSWSPAKA
ncbi:MAG TPA: hypothetical protein VH208_13160, partial [Myxococcaceae bacterium]|nr:hypothetical protein [Myxococcaceae bacterium]